MAATALAEPLSDTIRASDKLPIGQHVSGFQRREGYAFRFIFSYLTYESQDIHAIFLIYQLALAFRSTLGDI